jgi:hypothetical protein
MSDILTLGVIFEGSRDLKDRSKKLTFCTNEINPQQAASLQVLVQQFCYIAIKREDFTKEQIDVINDLKTGYDDSTKTPSQRMRNCLYKLWEQNNEGYKDFNLYYQYHMEIFINHLKGKIL